MTPDNANFSRPSDDTDSDRSSPATAGKPLRARKTAQLSTFAIDLQSPSSIKRPRGRPPGSKNKPKPPVVITRECQSTMKPVVLEISDGSDIIEAVSVFARRRSMGISLLSGSGSVSNVTLRHPSSSHAPNSLISLHGPFHLLSLWGSYMGFTTDGDGGNAPDPYSGSDCGGFGITLSGVQGQVFGGVVGGKVVAAGQVVVVAATYMHPVFHSLPEEDEEKEEHQEAEPCTSECQMSVDIPWSGSDSATTSRRPQPNHY